MCVVARNVLRDQRRQEARFDGPAGGDGVASESADEGTEEAIILTVCVKAAFARLPKTEADLLFLYGLGFTCEEIGERHRQSREWAKKRIQRARKRLRLELEAEGYVFSRGSDSASKPS